MTALPLNSSGRRPTRSTSQMATKVKAHSVPPTMAALISAACGRPGGGEATVGPGGASCQQAPVPSGPSQRRARAA